MSFMLYSHIVGVGWGTGTAVAHRAVDAVMGPRTIQYETVASEAAAAARMNNSTGADSCNVHSKAFQDVSLLIFIPFDDISTSNQDMFVFWFFSKAYIICIYNDLCFILLPDAVHQQLWKRHQQVPVLFGYAE